MKLFRHLYTGALVAVLLLTIPVDRLQAYDADDPANPRLITTTGDAEIRVIPDEVILTLGVETWDPDIQVAKGQNDAIVERVFGVTKAYEIDPAHVQTDLIQIEPTYNSYQPPPKLIGYFVRKSIVITVRDIAVFEELLTDLIEAGVQYVHGIQFRTTELRRYRDEARALAIQAAYEKAEALSAELGQSVGEPHMIREDQSGWWSWYGAGWGWSRGGGLTQNVIQSVGSSSIQEGSTVAPGQISVNARVTVSFALH